MSGESINNTDVSGYILASQVVKQSIGSITLEGCGELDPLPDATPREAIYIAAMLAIIAGSRGCDIDYASYVKKHGLERHFRK